MKKFTLLAAVLMVMSGSVAAQKRFMHQAAHGSKARPTAEVQVKNGPAKVRRAPAELFLPQHEDVYFYERAWKNTGYTDYTYDRNGNVLTSTYVTDEGTLCTSYEYDEDNRCTTTLAYSYDTDMNLISGNKRTLAFDSMVKDLVVESMEYVLEAGADGEESWTLVDRGSTWRRDVTRDDKGRVTGVSVKTYWMDKFEETRRTTVTYNEDGLAETWKYEELAYSESRGYYWEEYYTLYDMRWYSTDGQIVVQDYLDEFFKGNNRLKSARVVEPKYGDVGTMEAAYEENGNYTYTYNYIDPLSCDVYTFELTDGNGSTLEKSLYYEDLNGDGEITDDELEETAETVVTCNDNKDVVSEEFYEEGELIGAAKYDIAYGDYAYPVEWIMSEYDYDKGKYVPYIRLVRSNFVDVANAAAIDKVSAEAVGGVQGVYNLQGVRVAADTDNLPAGLYIVKKDGKTVKVVKK